MAGKYVGKDDPVMIVRCQSGLPAVGEVLEPWANPHLVFGCGCADLTPALSCRVLWTVQPPHALMHLRAWCTWGIRSRTAGRAARPTWRPVGRSQLRAGATPNPGGAVAGHGKSRRCRAAGRGPGDARAGDSADRDETPADHELSI